MSFVIEWLDEWCDAQGKVHIQREIAGAVGDRAEIRSFAISRTSDGAGIAITTTNPPSCILLAGEEWQKHGVIEKSVLRALQEPERSMLRI